MNIHSLGFTAPTSFRYFDTLVDRGAQTYWGFMHATAPGAPVVRPCFHPAMMDEMLSFQATIGREMRAAEPGDLHHVVLGSAASVFNLGGDLECFADCIERGDAATLRDYAEKCMQGVFAFHTGFGANLHTVALVQGDALGGGFEAALSCHTIVAEEGVEMGLPESLFGLFPGMGAYPFLRRRVGGQIAQRLIMSGEILTAERLHAMGVVDVLAPRGGGTEAVRELIRGNRRRPRTWAAVAALRQRAEPITLEELHAGIALWVDSAMALDSRSIKTMRRLVRAQTTRHAVAGTEGAAAAR